MTEIIELITKYCDSAYSDDEALAQIEMSLHERRILKSTLITEEWLKEHGFVLESDGYVFYDDSKGTHGQYYVLVQLGHNEKEARRIEIRTMWRSFYAEQGVFSASFLLDACEFCGIKMEV